MPLALVYPDLLNPSNTAPALSLTWPAQVCIGLSALSTQALLLASLVWWRGVGPTCLFGAQAWGRQSLSGWGGGDLAHAVRFLGEPFSPDLCCWSSVLYRGMERGVQSPPPSPRISAGAEPQPIRHTRLHVFIRVQFVPGLGLPQTE